MSDYDVGKLVASIELDSSQMAKDIKTITSQLKTLNTSFNSSSKDIDNAIGKVTQAVTKNSNSMRSGFTSISNSYRDTSKTITTLSSGIRTAMSTMSRTVDISFKSLANTIKTSSASNANAIKAMSNANSTAMARMSSSVSSATATMTKGFATIQAQSKLTTEALRANEQTLLALKNSYTALGASMTAGMTKGFASVASAMQQQTQVIVSALKSVQLQATATQTSLNSIKAPNLDMSKVGYQGNGVNRVYGTLGTAPNQVFGNLGRMDSSAANITSGLNTAKNAMNGLVSSASKAIDVFTNISFKAFLIEQGVRQIASIFDSLISPGMNFASSMETLRLGYSGIISSTLQQDEKDIPFNRALEISDALLMKMQDEALKTSLTMEELGGALQSTMALGIDAGMSLQQVLDLTVVGAQAVKTFGLSNQQVVQELRGLISGEAIRPGVDMLATVLGYTTATVNKLREEGTLYEDVMKRMAGFQAASNEFQNTWAGLISNLDDGISRVFGTAMKSSGLFETFKEQALKLQQVFFTINKTMEQQDNGEMKEVFTTTLNESTLNIVEKIYSAMAKLIKALSPIIDLLGKISNIILTGVANSLDLLATGLAVISAALTPLWTGLGIVMDLLSEVQGYFTELLDVLLSNTDMLAGMTLGLGALAVALLFLINPILGVVGAIGAIGLAWDTLTDTTNSFGEYFRLKMSQFVAQAKAVGMAMKDLFTLNFSGNSDKQYLQEAADYGNAADKAWKSAGDAIAGRITKIKEDAEKMRKDAEELFKGLSKKSYGDEKAGKKGKGAGKEASNAYKLLDADLKKANASFKAQLKEIEDAFKNNQLSTQDYIEAYLKNKQGQIDKQIEILKAKIDIAKSLGQENDVEKFSTELEKLEIDRAEALAEANRKLVDSYKKLQDTYDSISKSYHGLYGATEASTTLDIINELGDSYTRTVVELKTAQERLAQATQESDSKQIELWNNWVEKGKEAEKQILAIARAKRQEYEITQAQAQVEAVQLQSIRRENEINHLVEQSRMDSLTAEGRIFYERQQYVDDYVKTYAKLVALYETEADYAAKAGSLEKQNEWVKKAEDARAAMKSIVEEVPPFQKKLREGFSDGLAGMFDDLTEGKSWKESFQNFASNLLKEWASMWHKRLAQDITNKLFDAVLPKGEKALTIDTEFDVQVNEYKEEIKAQMEQGVQAVTEGSLNIKGQFDALIPTLQQFGETVQVAMAKMSSGSGQEAGLGGIATGTGGFSIGESMTGANYGGMSLENESLVDSLKDQFNGLTLTAKDFGQSMGTLNGLLAKNAGAQKLDNKLTMQAGLQALPNMLMGLAMVSGNEGLMKFAMALQVVMAVIQMINAMSSVSGFATGGYVSGAGTGTSDSIPAMLSNGEYVLTAKTVKRLGVDYLDRLNEGKALAPSMAKLPRFKFAEGGLVGASKSQENLNQNQVTKTEETGEGIQITFAPVFQSLDPEANMKAFDQQYPLLEKRIIDAMRTKQVMRQAVKGAAT